MGELYREREVVSLSLISQLKKMDFNDPLILGVAGGGLIIASIIADALNMPFDAIVINKFSHPHHSEYEVGGISEDGKALVVRNVNPADPRLHDIILEKQKVIQQRIKLFHHGRKKHQLSDRDIILVDEKLQTGITSLIGAKYLKSNGCSRVILVVPEALISDSQENHPFVDHIITNQERIHHLKNISDDEVLYELMVNPSYSFYS